MESTAFAGRFATMEFFARFRNPLFLVALLLAQVLGLALQVQRPLGQEAGFGGSPDGAQVALLRRWTQATVTPVERLAHGSSLHLRHLWWNYIDLRHARDKTQELQAEVRRLREEQAAFAEDAAQGRRLQAVLGFQQQYISKTVAAQVIGTSGTDRAHVLTLDKGWVDGLRPEQPVITPDGVVGKLRDVFPHSSQLLLLSDSSSGAGVILLSTRLRAILRGAADGEVQINNLTGDDRIKVGERIVTSGGDQVFPRGLPVGVITRIVPDLQHQPYTAITVKPAANLQQLEEVLVITGSSNSLPAAAQQDVALAETLAAENKRAADLIAERLPSLHESPEPERGDLTADGDPKGVGGARGTGDGAGPGSGLGSGLGSGAGGQAGSKGAAGQTAANLETAQIGGVPGVPNSGVPRVRPALHADRFSPGATPSAEELTPGAPANAAPAAPTTSAKAEETSSVVQRGVSRSLAQGRQAQGRPAQGKPAQATSTSAHLSKPSPPPAAPRQVPPPAPDQP